MSSDDAYASFLDQANQDTGATKGSTTSQGKKLTTRAVDTDIPQALRNAKETFTSESDEPFEPVSLKWDQESMPDNDAFGELIGHKGEVSDISIKEFDQHARYNSVLEAVGREGKDTKIFKVQHDRTRSEVYIVSLDTGTERVIGLKALSIES